MDLGNFGYLYAFGIYLLQQLFYFTSQMMNCKGVCSRIDPNPVIIFVSSFAPPGFMVICSPIENPFVLMTARVWLPAGAFEERGVEDVAHRRLLLLIPSLPTQLQSDFRYQMLRFRL